jgi:hypothetical protein
MTDRPRRSKVEYKTASPTQNQKDNESNNDNFGSKKKGKGKGKGKGGGQPKEKKLTMNNLYRKYHINKIDPPINIIRAAHKQVTTINKFHSRYEGWVKRQKYANLTGFFSNLPKFAKNLTNSNSNLNNFNATNNENKNMKKPEQESLKSKILKKISKMNGDYHSLAFLYEFFEDCALTSITKFKKLQNDVELEIYINKALRAIKKGTTPNVLKSEEAIEFGTKDLVTFTVLMWLDSIHDGYYDNTFLTALRFDKTSSFSKEIDLFPLETRDFIGGIIQSDWERIPLVNYLVKNGAIELVKDVIGRNDLKAQPGKFEGLLKNNFNKVFNYSDNVKPIVVGLTNTLRSDIPVRINVAIDQSSNARIQDTMLAIKYKITEGNGNLLRIDNTLTLAGLVDPGKIFLQQRIGHRSIMSGLFDVDDPKLNGKIVMDNIKFKFYHRNKNNKDVKFLFESGYVVGPPRFSGEKSVDFILLRLKNSNPKEQPVFLRPGANNKQEAGISKFFGDFYQVLINNAYNKDRKKRGINSYYPMCTGDGFTAGMHRYMAHVMGAPFALILDPATDTVKNSHQFKPLQFYFPPEVMAHMSTEKNIQSPQLTQNNTNIKTNSPKSVASSPIRSINKKKPIQSMSTKPGSRPRSAKRKTPTPRSVKMMNVNTKPRSIIVSAKRNSPSPMIVNKPRLVVSAKRKTPTPRSVKKKTPTPRSAKRKTPTPMIRATNNTLNRYPKRLRITPRATPF